MKGLFLVVVGFAVVAAGCGGDDPITLTTQVATVTTTVDAGAAPGTTTAGTSPPAPTTTLPDPGAGLIWRGEHRVPEVLAEFTFGPVWLDGEELFSGIADTFALRRQGLMHITDLGDLDGMVFVFEEDTTGGFWMKNTLVPLDIAFFDADGVFVDGFGMEPCVTDECQSYSPSASYRFALEMAAGTMPNAPLALNLVEPE